MDTTPQTSDTQSGGFLGLLNSLGTGYFNFKATEAAAEAAANASRTSLNSTGTPTMTTAPAVGSQWVPGVENKTLVFSGLAIVGLLAALAVLRAAK